MVYAYALIHDSEELLSSANKTASSTTSFTRVTSFSSGFDGIMSLHFDDLSSSEGEGAGYFWAHCDDTCKGHSAVFALLDQGEGRGHFERIGKFKRPEGMPNLNNEGFTGFPDSRCGAGSSSEGGEEKKVKGAMWCDDSDTEGHSLRQGTMPCGAFIPIE